ncbi:glutathione S-transferase [uncultured Aquincola sp.]|uniref:glutathione S-transferase n=1 Tax=uncultured Aquincola sp. TaxID=886556 RepID=UPI0032B2D3F9
MITVHHLENSRSQRVLWLLEEMALPYELRRYERDKQTMLAPPELRQVHPLGKSPVITDGEITMAESGAIIEYLTQAYEQGAALVPARGSAEWRRYVYWLHFAEGSLMPPLLLKLIFNKVRNSPMPFFVKPIARGIADKVTASFVDPNLQRLLAFMDNELAGRPWFAGEQFTAADVQMSFPLEAAAARGGLDTRYPNLTTWLARVHARPAYKRALDKGGPYKIPG